MLKEKIKTSFIKPKLIFYTTVALFTLTISLGYVVLSFAIAEPGIIIRDTLSISDSIKATVIPGG